MGYFKELSVFRTYLGAWLMEAEEMISEGGKRTPPERRVKGEAVGTKAPAPNPSTDPCHLTPEAQSRSPSLSSTLTHSVPSPREAQSLGFLGL